MKPSALLVAVVFLTVSTPSPSADEGMWTFDNPPLRQWNERYGFVPAEGWLDHVRLASVRLSDGGSGSFVSPEGLILTNQHVGRSQIQKLSTQSRNLATAGFYAASTAEELKCPDLEVDVLVSYEDVTAKIKRSVKSGVSDREANQERKAAIAVIEKDSTERTGLRSEVVTLYSGGEYWLYRFKRYTDVRLVFAPEQQIAYFGGDHDNFTYPRFNLDVAFFRAWENGRPANTGHWFRWSAAGPKEGEFVVLSGNPGSTNRLLTLAQLRYQRDTGNSLQREVWMARAAALERYASRGAEEARRASAGRLSLANSLKRLVGQQAGLMNPRLMGRKEEEERKLRVEFERRPELKGELGDPWAQLEQAYGALSQKARRIAYSDLAPSRLASMASTLVRFAEEVRKPNDRRYEEFRDSKLESLRFGLVSPAPLFRDLEEFILASWLGESLKALGADDPFVKAALAGDTPEAAARKAISESSLADAPVRQALLDGGAEAIDRSPDPLLALARRVEPAIRELRQWREDRIQSVDVGAGGKIASIRFVVYGRNAYPDASFSLRISYGTVAGYEQGSTLVPFRTTFFGLYDREAGFGGRAPFNLPPRWKDRWEKLDLSVPLNFVYTADTIGGNSGSPVINRAAEIVGVNFDSNLQKLPNRYMYIDETEGSRAIAVHSAGIIEALRSVYEATALVTELLRR